MCAHAASHTNGSPRSRTSPHGGASEESKTTAGYGYRGPNESLGDGRKAAPPPARRETTPGTMAWCHFNPVSEGASGPGVHIPRRWQHGDEPLARTLSPAAALLVCDNRQKLGENPVGPPSRGRPRAWVRVDRCLLQERPTPGASEGWHGPRRAHEVGAKGILTVKLPINSPEPIRTRRRPNNRTSRAEWSDRIYFSKGHTKNVFLTKTM